MGTHQIFLRFLAITSTFGDFRRRIFAIGVLETDTRFILINTNSQKSQTVNGHP